jgi:hypothetical protein
MADVDLSEFEAQMPDHPNSVKALLAPLTDEQRAKLEAAMLSPHITGIAIIRVLKTWGVKISDKTFGAYRRDFRANATGGGTRTNEPEA